VDHTNNLNANVKRKIPTPAGTRTPDHPARNPALYYRAVPDKGKVKGTGKVVRVLFF
jgi:hypothetical protein